MPKYPNRKKQMQQKTAEIQAQQHGIIDELKAFREFQAAFIPELQRLLVEKRMTAKEIAKKYEPFAAARQVMEMLTNPNAALALAAAKEIQDRASGKAVEMKKIEHSMKDLSDKELDALIRSEEAELVALESSLGEEKDQDS